MTTQTSRGTKKGVRARQFAARLILVVTASAAVAVVATILKGLAGASIAEAILTGGTAFGGAMGLGLAVINASKG